MMQTDNNDPNDRKVLPLGCAMFAPPALAMIGLGLGRYSDLGWALGVIGTFFLVLPWAQKNSLTNGTAFLKAVGLTVAFCLGWCLLGLAILFAVCGRH